MSARRALLLPLLVGAGITVVEGVASAQTQEFSVQRFEPAAGADNFLGVETLRMDGQWHWSVGLFFNYSLDPFVVQTCTSPTNCSNPAATQTTDTHVVRDMYTWDLLASVSPRPWLQLGLRLPVSYVLGDGLDLSTGKPLSTPLKAASTGDPDVEGKVRLYGTPGSKLLLGVAGDISFPAHSLTATNFIGDSSPLSGGLRGILDGKLGAFTYGANLRALFRKDVTVGLNTTAPNTVVGSEFRYGAAAGYKISPILEVLAEGFGGTGFRSEPGSNSLEIDAAARIRPLGSNFAITVGGGAGVLRGVGVPVARAFAGLLYAPQTGDKDGDGIPDDVDKCPTIPEDFDGFEDHDGCPEPDNDGDGIPDALDKCPNEPEDFDGYQDADGCPDLDNDGDGIPDALDMCPDTAETIDGFQDADGCPEPGARSLVRWDGDSIALVAAPARFPPGRADVPAPLAQQLRMMAQLARGRVLGAGLATVIIEGYADRAGDTSVKALELAALRSLAVKEIFIASGIPASRITSAAGDPLAKRAPSAPAVDVTVPRPRPSLPKPKKSPR